MEQIGDQLRIVAAVISVDLLDDELGASFHKELSNPQRQGCTQLKEQCFMLRHIVGCFEVRVHHIFELVPMWGEEQHPHTAPCLCEEPSKKRVQWGPMKTGLLSSGSWLSGPSGWLAGGVQTTIKSAST
jgi:hypothetical protein